MEPTAVVETPPTPDLHSQSSAVELSISGGSGVKKLVSNTIFAASFADRPTVLTPAGNAPPRLTEQDVSQNIEGVITLAKAGKWKSALRLIDKLILSQEQTQPHIQVQLSEFRLVAFIKLRLFKNAAEELVRLGNLDEPTYSFESYPEQYPGLKGSFIPFSLRLFHAELPAYQGNVQQSLDLLYRLLAFCKSHGGSDPAPSSGLQADQVDEIFQNQRSLPSSLLTTEKSTWSPDPKLLVADESVWRYRYNWVLLQIVSIFIQAREYPVALGILEDLSRKYPSDTPLLSALGRLHIQIGNIRQAEQIFSTVESLSQNNSTPDLVEMNRGLLAVATEKYDQAVENFTKIVNSNPNDLVAINNLAVSLLYTCQLTKALHLLEDTISRDPVRNLNEIIVFNLRLLYDFQSDNSAEKKHHLEKIILQYASDSFDQSILKR